MSVLKGRMCLRLMGVVWFVILPSVHGYLEGILNHYETLHQMSLQHRIIKRDTSTGSPSHRQIEFHALGKHFHLYLRKKSPDVLTSDFRVVTSSGGDEEHEVDPPQVDIYIGHALDEPHTSRAHVVWEDEHTMIATIQTRDELYVVEPSRRHLPRSDNYSMIVYRASDVDTDSSLPYCDVANNTRSIWTGDLNNNMNHHEEREHVRLKRSWRDSSQEWTKEHNTCELLLVADYQFFKSIGELNIHKTTTFLVKSIDLINEIYRNTDFDGITQMGFEIKQILIHQKEDDDDKFYSRSITNMSQLLMSFNRAMNEEAPHYCLVHLFTHRKFADMILGTGIAPKKGLYKHGICAEGNNAAVTNHCNSRGQHILSSQAMLVTAHELGHNWGSPHDTDECDSATGGKYLMYQYSVLGHDMNNKHFSSCSRTSIGQLLKERQRVRCLKKHEPAFCGNFKIEKGEECDPGPNVTMGDHACCTAGCRLRDDKQCSDENHGCCRDCMIADSSYQCIIEYELSCFANTSCDGRHKECPPANNKTDGTACYGRGECQNGECISFCEKHNMTSCLCEAENTTCYWCCKASSSSECEPYPMTDGTSSSYITLSDGMPCIYGYCEGGRCHEQVQSLMARFWHLIDDLTPSQFVRIMRDNIVGTVIIMSLCLWIPVSCAVNKKDNALMKQEKEHMEWVNQTNNRLIRPGDEHRIRKSQRVRYRKMNPRQGPHRRVARTASPLTRSATPTP